MPQDAPFDPGGFYQFDLSNGEVRSRGGHRVLMLSEAALAPLINTAVQNGDLTAVRTLGTQLGKLIAAGLPGPADEVATSIVLGHAAGVLALYGWGRLELERWGDALVLTVHGMPPLDENNLAVAALLGGLFSRLVVTEVACVPLANSNCYLMVEPSIAEQVWSWARDGQALPAIIGRLGAVEARV